MNLAVTSHLFDPGLVGKVVVVTGASSGLGVGAAKAFASLGAHLVLAARRTDLLEALAEELRADGTQVLVVPCDVTDVDGCETTAQLAVERFGRIDVLINNAGVGQAGSALREDPEVYRRTIDVNLNGAYWMSRACVPHMPAGSAIVNVSSVLGLVASLMPQAAYNASKAGLLGLTRDLAQQWTSRRGIRVNALCPGYFASEITETEGSELIEQMVSDRSLTGRFATMDEIVAPLLFLAGRGSTYMTGSSLVVDGGMSATI